MPTTNTGSVGGKWLHAFHTSLVSRSVCMPQRKPRNVQQWLGTCSNLGKYKTCLVKEHCKCIRSKKQIKASTPVQMSIKPHTYKLIDIPFSPADQDVVQAQALWAVISTNSVFRLFKDPEMQELFASFGQQHHQFCHLGSPLGGNCWMMWHKCYVP